MSNDPIDFATPKPGEHGGHPHVRAVAADGTLGDWRDALVYTDRGKLASALANAISILGHDETWRGVLAFDDFAQAVVTLRKPPFHEHDAAESRADCGPWTDADDSRAAAWLHRVWRISPGSSVVAEAVRVAARTRTIHPVRSYLDGLAWDGAERVDRWLTTYLGAEDTDYHRAVGRWWLVSAIARVYEPGCKADHAIILEGPQGIGKSTALRVLAGEWFTDTSIDLDSKDAYLTMRGRWIVELAELEGLARADAARLKAFFSSPIDNYRPPYGREPVQVPRQCVFAGSVNHSAYLKDETGGRRFWPVACGSIDLEGLRRDRDQLWAEACALYRHGAHWWPETAADATACAEVQAERYQADEWEVRIGAWVGRRDEIRLADVLEHALDLPIAKWTKADQTRAGACLARLGFGPVQRRVDGHRERVLVRRGGGR